ncbi:unnamed protein product [Peniophora sp. CBMAI 1063]|nr:unnamed protein product [Peniophora sp. CBMAI 1063]
MALPTQLAHYHGALQKRSRITQAQEHAKLEDARSQPASTTQCSSFGSIITFGAGLSVMGFLTGFESCVVRVRGLPFDAHEREIYALFTQQGIDKARLYLKTNRVVEDGSREVEMVMDSDAGAALSVGLDMLEFRDRSLSFEVHDHTVPGKMARLSVKDADVLTVSWREPSVGYIVTLTSLEEAHRVAQELDGSVCFGRRLKAAMYVPLRFTSGSAPLAPLVRITGVPVSATDSDIRDLVGADLVHLHRSGVVCANVNPFNVIRVAAFATGCRDKADIISIDRTESTDELLRGFIQLRARFRTWDQAKRVYDYLIGIKLAHGTLCRVLHSFPLSFTITIPILQYIAQRFSWNELHQSASEAGQDHCRLSTNELPGEPTIQISLSGGDPAIVGPLKVKVEELAASGELVSGWHPRLAQLEYREGPFVNRALVESGAFICVDQQRQQIRVYGSPEAIARGRTIVQDELARLAGPSQTQVARVPREAARDFMMRGVPELCEHLGEENVHFDPATCVLTTSGGAETRHLIFRVIFTHAAPVEPRIPAGARDVCPICYDAVQAPVRLACGHTYCTPCLRHFLRSAIDSDKFPLTCMGDEARCGVPIPIHHIECFLSKQLYSRLLQAVFRTYIARNPLTVRYCKTPNCQQVYRVASQDVPRPVPTKCPDCLVVVCPGCNQGAHEGYTCAEHLARTDPEEQERLVDLWVTDQGGRVQRCPQCRLPLEKTAGCNHVTCRCGVHICWRCWGISSESADEIYKHMRSEHGGYS